MFGKTVFRTNLILPWVVLDSSPASYLESHLPQKSAPLCGNTELKEARGTIIGPSGAITLVVRRQVDRGVDIVPPPSLGFALAIGGESPVLLYNSNQRNNHDDLDQHNHHRS